MQKSLEKTHILFAGPYPPLFFGQSIAFQKAFDNIQCRKKYLINRNFEGITFIAKVFRTILSSLKIFYYLAFKKIDLVYFTCSRSTFGSIKDIFLLNLAKIFGKKVINHLHGADFKIFFDNLPAPYKNIVFNSYKKTDVFIVLHDKFKQDVLSVFPQMNVKIIPNFYDDILDKYEVEKQPSGKIRLLFLSNIMKTKGIIELLDAFEVLSAEYDNLELSIAGEFLSDRLFSVEEIKKAFYSRINNDKITFHNVVSEKEKAQLLFKSDIFILPSYWEAFPLSVLEAMRAGNVIITSRINILPMIVNKSVGTLVEPGSSQAIAEAVGFFAENPHEIYKIQQFNMEHAGKNYSLKKHIDTLTRVMEGVVA